MVNPLSLRALLTSAAALTLSRAAVVDKRDCDEHNGYLQMGTTTGFLVRVTGYVRTVATYDTFGQVPLTGGSGERATFRFTGCQGGTSFPLYCTNCDPSGSSAVGTLNYTTSGVEPDIWQFYNNGPYTPQDRREEHITRRHPVDYYLSNFKWGSDGYIRPETFSSTGTLQDPTNAWYTASTDEITFIVDLGSPDTYYVLIWDEISS